MENISSENRRQEMELDNEMLPVNRYHDEEQDEFSARLPDEMVEKIISSLSFPYILQAKELSKEWISKFSGTKDAETTRFRQMVYSNCSKWPIFFPLAFLHGGISLTGFDRLTGTWLKTFFRLPCLVTKVLDSFPSCSRRSRGYLIEDFTGVDSLICGRRVSFGETNIFVLNVCTGIWKWLLPRPNVTGGPPWFSSISSTIYMLRDGSDYYKVLTMSHCPRRHQICMQLYESKSDAWTTKCSIISRFSDFFEEKFTKRGGVYLNGSMFFIMSNSITGLFEVWAYNVEKGTWHQLRIPGLKELALVVALASKRCRRVSLSTELIVSKDRLMLMVRLIRSTLDEDYLLVGRFRGTSIRRNSLSLYEINTYTENFSLVYRGPPERISDATTESYISDGDSIFFNGNYQYPKYIMEFSISRQEWILHPKPSSSACRLASFSSLDFVLQPGKNPFIVV